MTALPQPISAADVAELHNGDRMTQPEFHRIYVQMPETFRAELIGGIVYVASPLKMAHGNRHVLLAAAFAAYEGSTPGVESGDNATVILGEESEPQPDLLMRILPECGGQSRTTPDDYVEGAPELVAEVSHTTRSIDLHKKKNDYTRYGVKEYLVVALREKQVYRFDLVAGRENPPDPDKVLRFQTFPGFWIDTAALFAKNYSQLMATLERGLGTPEHAAFVEQLARAKAGS
jgi:Uma2 family endonuclease